MKKSEINISKPGTHPIILCSGGVDSLALVVKAIMLGREPLLFHIQYDHPAAEKELEAVHHIYKAFAGSCKLHLHKMEMFAEPLKIGEGKEGARFVRGRNLMFIAAAINASVLGNYNQVWLGATKEDQDDYWDCRPDFFYTLNFAIKDPVSVTAPLIMKSRKEVLAMIPKPLLYLAWSCYQPIGGSPCEKCNSCLQGK